jgi:flagellar M-ring protein FliF
MSLPFKSPVALAAALGVIVIAMLATVWWLLGSSNEVLFDKLDSAQLNNISAELDRAGIAYKIDREKSAITIAEQDSRAARLAVMSSGNALREPTGFELFDKSDFGMTDFAQKINYQRAMEGEIARTVSSLADVKYTRVHLVLPEHSLFKSEKQKPRASVTVFLNGDATLPADTVRGIQRITTSAVPDLGEQDVTVVDQHGTILSNQAMSEGQQSAAAGLSQKRAVEAYVADKIRQVLLPALGSGHFAVSVDAVLDLNQKTTTIEKVLEAGANVGVKRLKESSNRNLGDNGSDDLQREVEYAVGHESQQVVHSSGEIKRLQIGIVVDNDVRDVDLAKLREVVATAAGIDTARGDKIAVVQNNLAVQETLAEPEGPIDAASPSATYEDVAASSRSALPGPLLFLGGLALGVAFALLMLRNRRRQRDHIAAQRLRLELQRWVRNDVAQSRQP